MPFVLANPNQYLLVGRDGTLENRGSAVRAYLWPGTVHVLVPSTKLEAAFEFTQETQDGIPLRFKGIVIYRITEPVAAARHFDFASGRGVAEISTLLTHVSLGELRHAVSHMTMEQCIEQRKTTLSGVVRTAIEDTIHGNGSDWGVSLEVAQVAQVFIVDAELRAQLEAEVRNDIKLKSDQSDIRAAEESELTALSSRERVAVQQLAADQDALRRSEALANAQAAADRARLEAETPVALERIAREREVLTAEARLIELRHRVRAAQVEVDLAQPRAEAELRREMLRVEHEPQIMASAAGVLHGSQLSVYGSEAGVLAQVAPFLEMAAAVARRAMASADGVSDTEPSQRPA